MVGIWFQEEDWLSTAEESRGNLIGADLQVYRHIQSCPSRGPRRGKLESSTSSIIHTYADMEAFTMCNLALDHSLLTSQLKFLGRGMDTRSYDKELQDGLANMAVISVSTVDEDGAPALTA